MSAGVPLASVKSEIFEAVLQFMPDWIQIPVLVLIVLAVVGSWVYKGKRKLDERRARRQGRVPAMAPQPSQARGADFLGPYAPQQQPPRPAGQPSGADFLGSYAPPRDQGDGPV
ncbi:hypothetical protein ACFV46_23090 [Streptomyces sp. NPDC059852]|uniref:hypothetical protein n=1 Tax=Streptomyces sp. NPDC059852 TaxID=3346972 RepID=UPI003649CCB5